MANSPNLVTEISVMESRILANPKKKHRQKTTPRHTQVKLPMTLKTAKSNRYAQRRRIWTPCPAALAEVKAEDQEATPVKDWRETVNPGRDTQWDTPGNDDNIKTRPDHHKGEQRISLSHTLVSRASQHRLWEMVGEVVCRLSRKDPTQKLDLPKESRTSEIVNMSVNF